jgi:hypothetical protein
VVAGFFQPEFGLPHLEVFVIGADEDGDRAECGHGDLIFGNTARPASEYAGV